MAAHGVRLELRPDLEGERRERGELGGEDERRVLDGGPRVLGPGQGVMDPHLSLTARKRAISVRSDRFVNNRSLEVTRTTL